MATPTSRLKLKKQTLGSNLNQWGLSGGLNGAFDQVDVLAGYLEVNLGSATSYTFGTTNYATTGNEHMYRAVKFSGSPASGVTVNIPAVDDFKFVENATGQTITFSNGSTTATLANTFTGYIRTNGSSVITVLTLPDGVNVKTVADNIASVNQVATDSASVIAVAGKATEIGRLGTTAAVADLAALGGTAEVANLATLAPRAADIGTLAPRASDLQALAPREADLNTLSPRAADIGTLAPRASDLQALAPREADLNTLSPRASDLQTLSPRAADIGTLADVEDGTTATNALSTLAPISAAITGVNTIAADVTAVNTDPLKTNITNVSGNSSNINSVSGNSSNINTVAGQISPTNNISTLAGISSDITATAGVATSVTAYAKQYSTGSGDISTRADGTGTVAQGDLRFRSDTTTMRVYNGSAWEDAAPGAGNYYTKSDSDTRYTQRSLNLSDLASASTARTNLFGNGGVLEVNAGGSGAATHTQYGVLVGAGTGAVHSTAAGTAGQVLTAQAGANPIWANAASGYSFATQFKFT
jgi:hypothetical protein